MDKYDAAKVARKHKACIKCKYIYANKNDVTLYMCGHPDVGSFVTGEDISCSKARTQQPCTWSGQLFEPNY